MSVIYSKNNKIRLKITDLCNMKCSFCHSEGSRGVNNINIFNSNTQHIFKELNGIFDSVHITGGEPTLYHSFGTLIDVLRSIGYKKISITTNGYFKIEDYTADFLKLDSINFSLHSFNEQFLSGMVDDPIKYKRRVTENINYLKNKTKISINTVATSNSYQDIESIIDFCGMHNIQLNILQELNNNISSSIRSLIYNKGFIEYDTIYLIPGSNKRTLFKNNSGNIIVFKEIEYYLPEFLCKDCSLVNKCDEGFSFFRLEGDPVKVRLCINKEAITYEKFKQDYYNIIKALYRR